MAAATLAMKIIAADIVHNVVDTNAPAGARQLVLTIVSTAAATAVPKAASAPVDASASATATGMVGKVLTLNFDDATGVVTSLT